MALCAGSGRLPLQQEAGDGAGFHMAHGFKFAGTLAVEELAVLVEDGEGGNAFGQRNLVALSDVLIPVYSSETDIDVDNDVVGLEQGLVGRVVEVNVQDLTITAPVAAKVEDDVLVSNGRSLESSGEIGLGLLGSGVDNRRLGRGGRDGGDQESGEDRRQCNFAEM